jgi:Kef-type K+ transport system membrane component KefB
MLDEILEPATHLPPLARFAIALMIFLLVPPLCQRIRIPGVVGLLAAGGVRGPEEL